MNLQTNCDFLSCERSFEECFSKVDSLNIFSSKELNEALTRCKSLLSSDPELWDKRVNGCKLLRSIVASEVQQYDDFFKVLRSIETPIDSCLSDLRSQVVRESCITVAFLSTILKTRFEHFAESVLPKLINLIPLSAKVMANSGIICIMYILKNTFSPRIPPILCEATKSKSNIIRKYACLFIDETLVHWPPSLLEKHSFLLRDVISKSLMDADQDARVLARRSFSNFSRLFPDVGEKMILQMNASQRRNFDKIMMNCSLSSNSTYSKLANNQNKANAQTLSSKKPDLPKLGPFAANRKLSIDKCEKPSSLITQSQPASRDVSPSRTQFGPHHRRVSTSRRISMDKFSNTFNRSNYSSRENSPVRYIIQNQFSNMTTSSTCSYKSKKRESSVCLSDTGDFCEATTYRDDMSETSSISSEQSMRFMKHEHIREINNINEILQLMTSENWTDRILGLQNLHKYISDNNSLNKLEIRKIMNAFQQLFGDKQSKIIIVMLDTLKIFISNYHEQLHDWLYLLLTRLFLRQGCETLASHQRAISNTLSDIRKQFPIFLQFTLCCRFVSEKNHSPSIKVKIHLLEFIKDIVSQLPPNSINDLKLQEEVAIQNLISWCQEPKSHDVRRIASRIIIKLYELDSIQFKKIVEKMPSGLLEQTLKILKAHEKTSSLSIQGTSSNTPENKRRSSVIAELSSNCNPLCHNQYKPPICSRKQSCPSIKSADEFNERKHIHANINEDQTSILELNNLLSEFNQETSQFKSKRPVIGYQTLKKIRESAPENVMQHILEELSNHNERFEQRKACMLLLMKMFRDNSINTWQEHFKPLLLILLETFGDEAASIRALSLRVLQDLINHQGELFIEFIHLTIMKILEAARDSDQAVVKAAENCAQEIADNLPPDKCLHVLIPLMSELNNTTSLPALIMSTRVIANGSDELVKQFIDQLKPTLILACEHESSLVRKASIFCLVEIHFRIGEDITPFFPELTVPKRRLIEYYISRRSAANQTNKYFDVKFDMKQNILRSQQNL